MGMNEDDTKAFFDAGGAEFMFAMFEARDRREREAAEIDRMRREFTVKVKFPDGIREVEAHMASDPFGRGGDRFEVYKPTPNEMEGWRFVGVIGGEVEWHAMRDRITGTRADYFAIDDPFAPDEYRGEYR